MMLQRSQKPFVISMGGVLPSLTLAYYGSVRNIFFKYFCIFDAQQFRRFICSQFISSVMSYFMTMRAAIAK